MKPGIQKIQKLSRVLEKYSVQKKSVDLFFGWFIRYEWFRVESQDGLQNNFQIYCNAQEPPASLRIKLYKYQIDRYPTLSYRQAESDVKSDYFFVAYCRWLWTKDWQDVYGIGIRTDVTTDLQTSHFGDLKTQNQYRLAWQNLPADIEWVTEKINWLWKKALKSREAPFIKVDDKLELGEYMDLGDYM